MYSVEPVYGCLYTVAETDLFLLEDSREAEKL